MSVRLPDGWTLPVLKDIATLSGRIGWRGLTAKEYTEEGPLFLSVHSLNYGDYVDYRDAYHISQERYHESPEIMLEPDDILICKDGAGIGKVGIVGDLPGPSTINSSLLLIRSTRKVVPKFLYYLLISPYFQRIVQSRLQGATTPHLYQRDIAEFPVRLPSHTEQKRIVAVLDEAFAAIQTASENTEQCLTLAADAHKAFIHSLFVSADPKYFRQLGEIADFKNGLNFTKSSKGERVQLVGVGDFKNNYWVPSDRLETVQIDGNLDDDYLLRQGDIVVVRSNGNRQLIGRSMLMGPVQGKVSFSGFSIRIRPHKGEVNPEYLTHYLKTEIAREALVASGGGTNISSLSQKGLSTLAIYVPDLERQKEMVAQIVKARPRFESLTQAKLQKQSLLSELKQSLLHKAFTGELTANTKAAEHELVGAGV